MISFIFWREKTTQHFLWRFLNDLSVAFTNAFTNAHKTVLGDLVTQLGTSADVL